MNTVSRPAQRATTGTHEGGPMISSPCRNCDKRHMPKDMCMHECEKIAMVQQLQFTMNTPPYACNERSDTFPCRVELSPAVVPVEYS